jgi:hypothetical protein
LRDRILAPITGTGTPPTYLWQAIVAFLLFPLTGALALIFSFQVGRRDHMGDRIGAVRASRQARMWCLISLLVFTLWFIHYAATGNPS